jgi:LPXTG-motif cell wall-anchored protein
MKKIVSLLAILPVLVFSTHAFASSPGQLTGGPQVLEAKNITQAGSYSDTTSVACNEEVQYSTMLHNAGSGGLTNIQVTANLAGGSITATPAEGATYGTSDTTTVNVASGGTLAYESGTTKLYDISGNVLQTLPDTITSGGVNIGNMAGSTVEYVNFKAKVNCATPPPKPPVPQPKPQALPNTGAGDVLGIFAGASSLGAAGHYVVNRRRKL